MWGAEGHQGPTSTFYSASVYLWHGASTPKMFTPIFALSRLSGWTAHIYEQQSNNRLMRPGGASGWGRMRPTGSKWTSAKKTTVF